jgi:hypothetical protein
MARFTTISPEGVELLIFSPFRAGVHSGCLVLK